MILKLRIPHTSGEEAVLLGRIINSLLLYESRIDFRHRDSIQSNLDCRQ